MNYSRLSRGSTRTELWDDIFSESLDILFCGHRWIVHEYEVRDAGFDESFDFIQALLLAADDDPIARLVRSGLRHHRDDPGECLLALFRGLVAQREHQGLFDFIGIAPARISVARDPSDDPFRLAPVGVAQVPHIGMFRENLEQPLFAMPADHQGQMLLHRLWITDRVDHVVMLALERGLLLGEHPLEI